MNSLTLILILAFCIIATFSQATPKATGPQPNESFKLNQTQQHNDGRPTCSYTVTIKTSCNSFIYSKEIISLLFGDAYGNKVYVPIHHSPILGTYEPCSTHTYQIYESCVFQICRLYLYKVGDNGWIPETVSVLNYSYDPVTFYFGIYIPKDGYGFDRCHGV
ncbi:hypothetical protein VNO77_29381 [Canavalia gladiata]|uniref:Uncharacterized protein n=1 Tax=Canavalia gladiata TaxID=3824 RepID=A0AAN9KZC9_CANGL